MTRPPHLHLVNATYPRQGAGSEIVLLRHLVNLQRDGWRVSVSAPFSESKHKPLVPDGLRVVDLPSRKAWWPPHRAGSAGLEYVRTTLLARALASAETATPPTHVLSNAYLFYPMVGLRFARKTGAKFVLILHDQDELWPPSEQQRRLARRRVETLTRNADRVLAVSEQLLSCYDVPSPRGVVLPPIPGDDIYTPAWTPERRSAFKIFHAGMLHACQTPPLAVLAERIRPMGGTLVVISPDWNEAARALERAHPNVTRMPPFERNEDAVRYVSEHGLAFAVTYAFDLAEQPWARTSFPSKMLEFMRAGLPVLLMAPPGAAVSSWAVDEGWAPAVYELTDEAIDAAVSAIAEQQSWEMLRRRSTALAEGRYSARAIQEQFLHSLSEA